MSRLLALSMFACAYLLTASCGQHVETGDNEDKARERRARTSLDASANQGDGDDDDDEAINPGGGGGGIGGGDGGLGGGDGVGDGSGGDEGEGEGEGGGDGGSSEGGGTEGGGTGGTSGTSGTSGTGTGTSTGTAGGGTVSLTCFGANPVMPEDFALFCRDEAAAYGEIFRSTFQLLCDDQRLINLALYGACAWNGEPEKKTKRRRIFSMTSLSDTTSRDFAMTSVYAVTTDSSPDEHWGLYRAQLTDPAFGDRYVTIRNSAVSDIERVDDNHYRYSARLANSAAAVSFRAELIYRRITPRLSVVYDWSYDDLVILKEHRLLRFLIDLGGGRTRLVAIDDKLIDDGGNHELAYTNLIDVLDQRMEADYENPRRD